MKRTLNIILIFVLIAGIAGLSAYIFYRYQNQTVKQIKLTLFRGHDKKGFLNKKLLLENIENDTSVSGKTIKEADLKKLITRLQKNPYVGSADAFFDISGNLIVNIKEKTAVVKVYSAENDPFYIDNNGKFFPCCHGYAPDIIIANGYIKGLKYKNNASVFDSVYKRSIIVPVFRLAKMISEDAFLKASISQIYVNSKNKIDLVPVIGNQLIRFGTIENAALKLDNLKAFYQKAFVKQNGNRYSQINLEFINQIVCTKK
jgi:cell division protein FtsQ